MIRRNVLGGLAVSLVCLATTARAQTIYGPGGLFVYPSAFTPVRGTFNLNASFFTQTETGRGRAEWQPTSLTYSPTDRAQLGASFIHRHREGESSGSGGVFGKYRLISSAPDHPATVSVVGSYLGPGITQSSLGVVASQSFKEGDLTRYTGHLGVRWARKGSQDGLAAFVGAQATLSPSVSVLAEFGTRFRFDVKASTGIGVVWAGRGQSLGVGYVNTGGSQNSQFFIGAGYPLGGAK